MASALLTRTVDGSLLVFEKPTGRCLAGVGANFYRPWLYPLYTPGGQIVLREFPFDVTIQPTRTRRGRVADFEM